MFLSIIVTVYNLEEYILQCLSTIIAQDFEDYEIIVVDDGSSDRSAELCLKFAADLPRIRYLRKNNGGASGARNLGLQNAIGDYIIFMDGDDFLEGASCLSELQSQIQQSPDFVLYGCCDFDNRTGISQISRSNYGLSQADGLSKGEIVDRLVENGNFPGAAWLFCVNRRFLLQNHIQFKEGIKAEDLDWIFSIFQRGDRMAFLDTPFYIYRKNREGSATKTFDRRSIDGLLYFIGKWVPVVESDHELHRLRYVINFHYVLLLLYGKSLSSTDFTTLEVNKKVLKYPRSKLLSFISWFVRIMGLRTSHQLFNLLTFHRNAS